MHIGFILQIVFKKLALSAGLSMLMKIRQFLCTCLGEGAVDDSTEMKSKEA